MEKSQANAILEQLGGNRFIAMTGAKHVVYGKSGLVLKIGQRPANKATHLQITLDAGTDSYTVQFLAMRGVAIRLISRHVQVAASELRRVFEEQTKLDTHL